MSTLSTQSALPRRWLPSPRLIRGLSGLLLALALPCPALAQDIATAEALFNRGREDMALGRYESACKSIAESHRLDPRPGTLFTLAVCETRWGRIATAAARYGDYLSLYERLPKTEQARQKARAKEAKTQRAALLPLVPELTLVLPKGAPAATVVQRDGTVVADAALGVGLPVDPGEHVLTTEAPGRPTREQRISIAKGEKKQLVLEIAPAPEPKAPAARPEKAPPDEVPAPSNGRRTATYVIGGIGVAGLVLGGVMGGLALGKKATVNAHCGGAIGQKDRAACDSTGLEAVNTGKPVASVSTVGFAVGGAAVGAALVLLLTEPKRATPAEGSSSGWRTVPTLQVGPAGALAGVRGIW